MAKKTSLIIYEKRLQQVQSWILQDIPYDMMLRQILQMDWCKERQARQYITDASQRWARRTDSDLETKRRIKIAELQERKRSLKEEFKGTPAGMKVLNDIDKMIIQLEGLNAPVEVNHNLNPQELMKPNVKFIINDQRILEYRQSNLSSN